jgi:hypothetical protein
LTFLPWEGVGYAPIVFNSWSCMRLIARFLLWLLIAALPLQGVAAAAMACQDGLRQGTAVSHQMTAAPEYLDAATTAHCTDDQNHHPASAHGKCSQCASCCTGAAAPPAMDKAVTPADLPTTVFAAPEPAMTIHVPATLERPPRQSI